jgi:ribosomal protein S27E
MRIILYLAALLALFACHRGETCVRSHTECVCSCIPTGNMMCVPSGGPTAVCDEWAKAQG